MLFFSFLTQCFYFESNLLLSTLRHFFPFHGIKLRDTLVKAEVKFSEILKRAARLLDVWQQTGIWKNSTFRSAWELLLLLIVPPSMSLILPAGAESWHLEAAVPTLQKSTLDWPSFIYIWITWSSPFPPLIRTQKLKHPESSELIS